MEPLGSGIWKGVNLLIVRLEGSPLCTFRTVVVRRIEVREKTLSEGNRLIRVGPYEWLAVFFCDSLLAQH